MILRHTRMLTYSGTYVKVVYPWDIHSYPVKLGRPANFSRLAESHRFAMLLGPSLTAPAYDRL